MELQLFNSLEKRTTKLSLQSGQTINLYLCGPTVYDHIHLGNLRPVIIFDILHRLLLHLNIKVNYVQNITDIDDKIIAKAQKEKKSEKAISRHYTEAYFDNLTNYNILFPTASPQVTDYIPQIQTFIVALLAKKVAYQKEGEIFFRIAENKGYGQLSGQNLRKLKSGTREITITKKEDEQDFLLWKKTKTGTAWNSVWGLGRPGWHTECVVFIQEFFKGKTIDIHGGGNDLLFPHHENERIQFLAYNNKELSKVWLHIAHLHWKAEKMSKSLGNVILAKHFQEKYGANVFRYLLFNSHYNQVINFNEELVQQAVDYTEKIKNLLKKLNFYLYNEKIKVEKQATKKSKEIIACLLNNLNTIKVLYYLEEIINFLNKIIDKRENESERFQEGISDFYFILDILGFNFNFPSYSLEVRALIKKWQELRKNGEYIQADKIRGELQKKNII